MLYSGSQIKILDQIVPILQDKINKEGITEFYDVFCGGANVVDCIDCENLYANDLSPTLIALHEQAQEDFSLISEDCTREDWDNAYAAYRKVMQHISPRFSLSDYTKLNDMPLYQIGAIEWYASYSAGGFAKGFQTSNKERNFYKERRAVHLEQANKDNYKRIKFSAKDYRQLDIPPNALIYCDAPHKGQTPYQIDRSFNYLNFYQWIKRKSLTNPIFISECQMPDDYEIVTSIKLPQINKTKAKTENLYFIDRRK